MTIVGHEKFPVYLIISSKFQLWHTGVVANVTPLDVNWRLFVATARRVLFCPVHLVHCTFYQTSGAHTNQKQRKALDLA